MPGQGPLLWADEFDVMENFGTASVSPESSAPFPQTMLVDYVRVYAA